MNKTLLMISALYLVSFVFLYSLGCASLRGNFEFEEPVDNFDYDLIPSVPEGPIPGDSTVEGGHDESGEFIDASTAFENYPNEDFDESELPDKLPAQGWFSVTAKTCNVRRKPLGQVINVVAARSRLWVELSGDSDWYVVYTKRSLAYMHKMCFVEEL